MTKFKAIFIGITTTCIAIFSVFLFSLSRDNFLSTASNSDRTFKSPTLKPTVPLTGLSPVELPDLKSISSQTNNSIRSAELSTTYRPSQERDVIQHRSSVETRQLSKWWLLARSPQEARWLDRYGFPTIKEEMMLSTSSNVDLEKLSKNGDLNAVVHLAVREAEQSFSAKDIKAAGTAISKMNQSLAEGGPYQAMTVLRGCGNMLVEFMNIPQEQRTEQQRQILEQYSQTYELAAAVGKTYGDSTFIVERNIVPARSLQAMLGLKSAKLISAAELADLLALGSKIRLERNADPMVIVSRPLPPSGEIDKFPRPDEGPILERQ